MKSQKDKDLLGEGVARSAQHDFIARGLAARDEARRADEYFDTEVVHADRMLAKSYKIRS